MAASSSSAWSSRSKSHSGGGGRADAIVQWHSHRATKTFPAALAFRVIDEDAAHHLRRDSEKVRAILPDDALLPDEPQICLVDKRGWLKRVVFPFAA